jgi:hypothetical protein
MTISFDYTKLKPCERCGQRKYQVEAREDGTDVVDLWCRHCGILHTHVTGSPSEAIHIWNEFN